LAIGRNVIRIANIEFVDLCLRHELVDLDGAFAFNSHSLEFFARHVDIFAFSELIAFDDVGLLDVIAGFGIDLTITDAIAGLFVELMEADFFALGCRRVERDRARNEGKLEISLPIRTRGH
jgi:hypothetical protein